MKILVADNIDKNAIEAMQTANLDINIQIGMSPDELLTNIPAYNIIAVRSQSKITKEIIDAGKNLQLIVRAGTGLDNIDCDAAALAGIEVRNTPQATTASVAELAFGLMISLIRHIPAAHNKLSNGTWDKTAFMGTELFGKTLGIFGLGRIGRELAKRAKAFNMNVVANDPFLDVDLAKNLDIPLLSSEKLLAQADFMSFHLPLTEKTKNFINAECIAKMKTGTYLINCARGGIVEEAAVAAALKTGHLAGAAFDVFAVEPLEKSPLMGLSNVILTPHLGAATYEGQKRSGIELAKIICEFVKNTTRAST